MTSRRLAFKKANKIQRRNVAKLKCMLMRPPWYRLGSVRSRYLGYSKSITANQTIGITVNTVLNP